MHVCAECGQRYERAGYCAADGYVLADAPDPLLGSEVLRYRLARLIGEGGMGRVYLGVQPQIGARVAIKILSDECACDPELVDRFFSEARAVNLIRHENIVSVLDLAKLPDGRPFIVMEYIEGHTLGAVIRRGGASLGTVVRVVVDVLSALDAAHAIGIVHRDLKPDNILITGNGHAKVLDFGIAKLAPNLQALAGMASRTQTGALLGTPAYMSPEQVTGAERVDLRSDLYSVGVVLFEAVTSQLPFAGGTLFDVMRAQLEDAPPSPRRWRPELPLAIEDVIMTALAKQPERRFRSAAVMATALEQAAGALTPSPWRDLSARPTPRLEPTPTRRDTPPAHSVVNAPTTSRSPARRRARWPFAVGLLGIGAIAGVAASTLATSSRAPTTAPVVAVAPAARAPAARVSAVVVASGPDAGAPAAVVPPAAVAVAAPAVGDEAHVEVVVPPPAPAPRSPTSPGASANTRAHAQASPSVHATPGGGPPAKSPNAKRSPVVAPAAQPPSPSPVAPPPPFAVGGTSEREVRRAAIAKDFGMHRDHVALPDELPIERRPRMSRGTYDPSHFDYRRFLPQATRLAKAEFADARLLSFEVFGVAPDGHATIRQTRAEFRFGTATENAVGCVIVVSVLPDKVETYLRNALGCDAPITLPRCTFAEIWQKARAIGTTATDAHLGFRHGRWMFSAIDLTQTLDDDCP